MDWWTGGLVGWWAGGLVVTGGMKVWGNERERNKERVSVFSVRSNGQRKEGKEAMNQRKPKKVFQTCI